MAQTTISLSVGNIRQLISQTKELSRALKDDIKVDMEQAMCAAIADDVRAGIASIQDVDGNYLGGDPSAVTIEVGLPGHDVIWRGEQIAYLEFGTGAKGAAGGYPRPDIMAQANYHPDPTKEAWDYLNQGHEVTSFGGDPYAPMANASAKMRHIDNSAPARLVLKEALQRAVTV